MVCGLCSSSDMEPLTYLDMILTGETYVCILAGHLYPFMSIVHSDRLGQFLQDNAVPYMSRIATELLQEHSSEFKHLCWPPNFPDMKIMLDALQRAVEVISNHLYAYGFMDSFEGCMVSILPNTTSEINRVHAT